MMTQPTPPAPAGTPAPGGDEEHDYEQKFCTYVPGNGTGWLFRPKRPVVHVATWLNIPVIAGAWFPPVLVLPAAMWVRAAFYLSQQVVIVPESCYAVVTDGGKFLVNEDGKGYVLGSGVHEVPFGADPFLVRTNELVLDITVQNVKLADEMVLSSTKIQVTAKPDPRIAGEDGVNVFARWVREGKAVGDDERATHNAQHGLEAELMGKLRELLSEVDSNTFDKSQRGFTLWLLACLSCHDMPENDSSLCPFLGLTGNDLLDWYERAASVIEKWIEKRAAEFAVDYKVPLDPHSVSHAEGHIGCSVDNLILLSATYSPESLKAKQAKEMAEKKGKGVVAEARAAADVKAIATEADAKAMLVKAAAAAEAQKMAGVSARAVAENLAEAAREHAKKLRDLGVTPDAAATAGNAVVERGELKGTVLVGGGSAASAGAGLAAGMDAVNNPPQAGGGTP